MGSIEAYETTKGRRYRVLYRRPDHLQTSKRGFRRKLDADLFLATVEVDKATGRYIDPSKTRATVSSWMARWLATRTDLRATTRTRVEGIIANYIDPELGRVSIGSLNRLRVQEWAAELPGSPETIRKVVNVLSGALQFAVEDGRLPSGGQAQAAEARAHRQALPDARSGRCARTGRWHTLQGLELRL
jgi:hypothetical protein